jgi:acyl dehydratase
MTELQTTFPSTATYEGTVDEDAVAAYALATNDRNRRYQDGQAAPLLFTATLALDCELESQRAGNPKYRITGATTVVHGEHDVRFFGAVRPGMTLRWKGSTFSARQTKGGVLVVQRISVSDEAGTRLVEHYWGTFHARATISCDMGPAPAGHLFPESARTHPVGTKVIQVERDQAFRYAGVSGDRVGHAINDRVARSEGYPGKILQGMCTFGLASAALVDVVAGGDPDLVRRVAVRFSRPAFPRKDLEVHVYQSGPTETGDLAFGFEGIQNGVTVLKHGRIELTRSAGPGSA